MEEIKIHVLHTGSVNVSKNLPFGDENTNMIKASGLFASEKDRVWLPVSSYLIEHPKGKVLFDCGWHRSISPNGEYDKAAIIKTLGLSLYMVNPGILQKGQAVNEQLLAMGIKPEDLDIVIISHLDCDHVNGLELVKDAKQIIVSNDDLACAKSWSPFNMVRYQERWWKNTKIKGFDWNSKEGPFEKSYDLFGDGSIKLINIPGHSEGLCAMKITNKEGKYVLLFSDGGYSSRSWKEMIIPGIVQDKQKVKISLQWIHDQSIDPNCIESLANHDSDINPHIITL